MPPVRVGTAGWAIPRAVADRFAGEGSGLQRYAGVFNAAEINSTFYRPHRALTYARWVDDTPPAFRFAVKLARAVTHDGRLSVSEEVLAAALADLPLLKEKLGPLLVQLPPSLAFDRVVAAGFFGALRARFDGAVACEPRHVTWFEPDADDLMRNFQVARVAADPARHPSGGAPGGWPDLAYWRLHGSPRMYFSAYGAPALEALAARLAEGPASEVWCMFDNTASGAAAQDALCLKALLEARA